MRTQSRELTIAASCESVWGFLADYRNDLLWRDELKECRLVSGRPREAGAMYYARIAWEGLYADYHVVCTALSRPSHIGYRTTVHGAPTASDYTLYPQGDATLLVVSYMLTMEGPMHLLEPFAWGLLTRWSSLGFDRLPLVLQERLTQDSVARSTGTTEPAG